MDAQVLLPGPSWKRSFFARFKATLPPDRQTIAHFKIFYSDIRPSRLVIVGMNPGGNPHNPETIQAASLFYDDNEHDYVDCGYPLALKMRTFLVGSGIAGSHFAVDGTALNGPAISPLADVPVPKRAAKPLAAAE